MNRYSSLGAREARAASACRCGARSATALWAFLKHYIFKRGFKDGWAGFVIALGNFEGTFYRYAKRYEEAQDWEPPPSEKLTRPETDSASAVSHRARVGPGARRCAATRNGSAR